jgi:hypothetical protein
VTPRIDRKEDEAKAVHAKNKEQDRKSVRVAFVGEER